MQLTGSVAVDAWRERVAAWCGALAAAERGRFALWLPVALVAGAALYYTLRHEPAPLAGATLVGGSVMLVLIGRGRVVPRAAALLALAGALGFAAAQYATRLAPPLVELPSRASIVVGTVRAVEVLPQGVRVTLASPRLDDGTPLPRALRIRLRAGDPVRVATGDTLRVRAMLRPPSSPALPGGWDIQFDAFHAGLGGYGYALNPAERLVAASPAGLRAWMQALQERLVGRVRAALPPSEGTIAASLLVGGMASILPADRDAFRASGLSHLLSISGLHLAIAMGLVFGAVRLGLAAWEWAALRWPTKAIAALCALAGGGFYTLLTGAQVPMLRSFAMAALVTLGVLVGRRALSLRGWSLAMAAVVLVAPQEVVGVSFQMSFSAVLALVAGFEALRPTLQRLAGENAWHRRAAVYVAGLAITSALAGTASAPFAAYHFGHVQLYYVAANMLAVPLTAVWVMPAGVLALLLMPLGLEWLALVPMGWGVSVLLWIAHAVAAWPEAVLAVPHITAWGLALLSLGMAWLALWRSRLRLLGLPMLAAGLLSPTFARPPDLLVSADARLIGLRTDRGLFVQRSQGQQTFVLDSWRQRLAVRDAWPLPGAGQQAADGAIACGPRDCLFRPDPGRTAALLLRGEPDAAACAVAVVVSAEPVRLDCPVTVAKVDRFSVWREGAHAVWLEPGGARVLSDRQVRGVRPWVIPLPTRSRQPPGAKLPPAEADTPEG